MYLRLIVLITLWFALPALAAQKSSVSKNSKTPYYLPPSKPAVATPASTAAAARTPNRAPANAIAPAAPAAVPAAASAPAESAAPAADSSSPPKTNPIRRDFYDRDEMYFQEVLLRP